MEKSASGSAQTPLAGCRGLGRAGFSLIELVIVVVIIALIGAVAIPRMSRAAAGASDSSLIQDLSTLRGALDLYQSEHGGNYPTGARLAQALLRYTDDSGQVSSTQAGNFIYGPYLRQIPPQPVGKNAGKNGIDVVPVGNYGSSTSGWVYDPSKGTIAANTGAERDDSGVLYSSY